MSVIIRRELCADYSEHRKSLAAYMLRARFSLAKTAYDAASGTVVHRTKMHATLKRNFQVIAENFAPGDEAFVCWAADDCLAMPDHA